MMEVIIYFIKVLAVQGILFGFYWLFLRKSARHAHNRYYLLASLFVAFVIPFISVPLPGKVAEVTENLQSSPVIFWISNSSAVVGDLELVGVRAESQLSIWTLLPWLYLLVSIGLLARSLTYLFVLKKLKRHSKPIRKDWFTLFKTSQTRSFSFFSDVFIPRPLFGSNAFDQVLAHECVHVKQLHSLDRLLLDFVVSLFWFNPFIYLYRNALIEIHEYQADEGVLKRYNDPIGYQEVLYSQLQSPQYSGLVSHFNFQMIKKRIVMMNNQKKRAGWVYVLTVPVMLMMIFAFSSKEAMKPLNEVGEEISSFIGPITEVREYAETLLLQDDIPSILPFKDTEKIRVTSGFGMRMHPVMKVKKMHMGMDFACEIGTEIVGTADGEVSEIQNKPDGYGKLIIIDHGSGYKTYYAQLSQFKVKQGEQVKKGQVIGLSGNSGMSTAPHLHYEVKKGDRRVDPAKYIKNYTFSAKETQSYQAREAKESVAAAKSKQELVEKEQELARREQELAAREQELAASKRALAKEEMERASERQELAKKKELEDRTMESEKELIEKLKRLEEKASKLSDIKVSGTSGEDPPLYVFDGEIISNLIINQIDPQNIESITVLKNESAKKKYGKKGKNGVVEIYSKNSKVKNKDKQKGEKKSKSKVKAQAYRVIIDPGHGGNDGGAVSPNGVLEKEVTLQIAEIIKSRFEGESEIDLRLTRTDDLLTMLDRRSQNGAEADLFISLHTDNYSGKGSFVSPVYSDVNEFSDASYNLAQTLASEFEELGKKTMVGYSSGYYVLNNAKCPAVMLNMGWFSDPDEEKYLSSTSGQLEIAGRIESAIRTTLL